MTDPNPGESQPLFDEFPAPTYDEWYEKAIAMLKGASFEKVLTTPLYEGLVLQPIYHQQDVGEIKHRHTLPGSYPYVRGTEAAGYLQKPWEIAQAISTTTPEEFNTTLLDALERGQTMANLPLDTVSRQGLDPDDSRAKGVGQGGVSIATAADFAHALRDVPLETTPLYIQTGGSSVGIIGLLQAVFPGVAYHGAVVADPLGELAANGELSPDIETAYDHLSAVTMWAGGHAPDLKTIGISTAVYHNGGANAVQELACMLATGAAYYRAMMQRGLTVNAIAEQTLVTFAIGAQFFLEVAKLRAARMLWAQMVRAFGGDEQAQKIALHVESGRYNKTIHDPYVNMLRTTLEGFAGAVGGMDSMELAPFDSVMRQPDEFSRRIARNQQLILQHEANLTRIIDPAGGSWYVEGLTDWLARESWLQFQRIEASGGMLEALEQGIPQDAIAGVAAQRRANLAKRKDRLVGTNVYPNLSEVSLIDDRDYSAVAAERGQQIKMLKAGQRDLSALNQLDSHTGVDLVDQAVKAAESGATLGEITAALANGTGIQVPPVSQQRGAEIFERLRARANAYAAKYGNPPQVFLANMGPLRQHKARADFTVGFFEVGGFAIIYPAGFDTPTQAATTANESGAKAVVICSTDASYPELVPSLVRAIKSHNPETIVILAGYPEDQIEAHKASGIDEFIHIRANCYDMNVWLQEQLGLA